MKVLVVDDEEPIRSVLTRLLTMHGHSVETACDGLQALDILGAKDFDLLIIDQSMPHMTGIDVVATVRTSARCKGMKILMATSASVTKDVEDAFDVGVDGYLIKPFRADQLLAKIEKLLKP